MARKPKNGAAGPGHNSGEPLTDDEIGALQHYFANKIRAQVKKAEAKKAEYDLERGEVNALFAAVKSELRYSRKEFEEVLAAQAMTEAEFRHAENKRARRFALHGLPVGSQLDMFATDTVGDQESAEADGYRAGLRADDPTPPGHIASVCVQDWMRGYHRGQEENILKLGKAEEILAARKAAEPVLEDDTEEEEQDPLDPDEIAAKARKLKNSGFMEPTPEEQTFAEAAA